MSQSKGFPSEEKVQEFLGSLGLNGTVISGTSLDDLFSKLSKAIGEDCGNSNCPIHAKAPETKSDEWPESASLLRRMGAATAKAELAMLDGKPGKARFFQNQATLWSDLLHSSYDTSPDAAHRREVEELTAQIKKLTRSRRELLEERAELLNHISKQGDEIVALRALKMEAPEQPQPDAEVVGSVYHELVVEDLPIPEDLQHSNSGE